MTLAFIQLKPIKPDRANHRAPRTPRYQQSNSLYCSGSFSCNLVGRIRRAWFVDAQSRLTNEVVDYWLDWLTFSVSLGMLQNCFGIHLLCYQAKTPQHFLFERVSCNVYFNREIKKLFQIVIPLMMHPCSWLQIVLPEWKKKCGCCSVSRRLVPYYKI